MYICAVGDHQVSPNTPMRRVVTEIRKRTYENGGTGYETVVEEILCPKHQAEALASVKEKRDELRRQTP